ncbi:MAG: Plug domain-containing protein [Rubricoccaceae bacterium]|nr:Plug domain-containing protein [Rubricoccaceae bacterium]
MRHCLALIAFVLGVRAAAQAPPCPGAITVTHDEIETSGAATLADVLRLLPPLRRTSVDGFAWRFDDGLGVPGDAAVPVVLVDGVPADLWAFGAPDLEELPLPLPSIARITYCPAPAPVAGLWASRGTLRFETHAPEPGLSTRGAWQIGNETGDPGPYRYTERETPNVDKSGPDVEGAAQYEAGPVGGVARFRALRAYATDEAINPRTGAATRRGSRSQRLITAEVRGAVGRTTRHALGIGGRYVSGLPFFEAAGRELPLRRLDAHLGLGGPLVGPLRYRLGTHVQRADDEDDEIVGFEPRWRRRTVSAALYGGPSEADGWGYGASLARTDASGAGFDAGFTLATAYGRLAHTGRALGTRTALALTATGDALGAKAVQTLTATHGAAHLALTLALDRRLPEEAPGFGSWRAEGRTGFERDPVDYRPSSPTPQTEAQARLDGRLGLDVAVLQGGVRAWAARGLFIERPAFGLADDASTAVGTVTAVPDAEGGGLGAWAEASGARGPWRGSVFYSLLAPLGGSDAFEAAWARVPRHRAGATVTLRPSPSFTLHGRFEARSVARWPGYAAGAGAVGPTGVVYTDETPALTLLDLAVEQGLWDRRARVSLLFRNLLDTEERYHPLGGTLAFRLYARVTVDLQGPLWVGARSRSSD